MNARAPDPEFAAWIAAAKAVPLKDGLHVLGWNAAQLRAKAGPCPACGGRDRCWINPAKGAWACRHCQTGGGNALSLMMHVPGADFLTVCAGLAGPAPGRMAGMSEERRAELAREREEAAARRAADAAAREEQAKRDEAKQVARARELWGWSRPVTDGDAVWCYWRLRGLTCAVPDDIRLHTRMAYWASMKPVDDKDVPPRVIWTGPAMVSAARNAAGEVTGCHITWLHKALASGDIEAARVTKGKAVITHPETGEVLKAKKMRGVTRGAAIWLTEPRPFMLAGEGIETTATALSAFAGRADVGAQVGMSLSHLAAMPIVPGAAYLMLGDGDSEPGSTRKALKAACAHALAQGAARAAMAMAPGGRDFNDLVMA
jgi:hypothetical protein